MKNSGKNKRIRFGKLNNRGSAIVTAIVVVAFICILATTILYVSGMNYYIKTTDAKTKQSFYEAETALEEIKAALVVEVSDAAAVAYQYVMENHASIDSDALEAAFQDKFFVTLRDNWNAHTRTTSGLIATDVILPEHYLAHIRSKVDALYLTEPNKIWLETTYPVPGELAWENNDAGQPNNYATLYGVQLQYTSAEGYTTIIATDYVVLMPKINWTLQEAVEGEEPGGPVASGDEIDLSTCVQYSNWVKK